MDQVLHPEIQNPIMSFMISLVFLAFQTIFWYKIFSKEYN